ILDVQVRIDQERDRIQREAAAKELATSSDKLAGVAADLAGVAARIQPALSDVLGRLPPPHAVAPERIKAFADGLVEALQVEVDGGRRSTARLVAGDAVVVSPPAEETKPPPAPIVERQQVFVLAPSKWQEPDGSISTSGAHCTVSPPIEIARAAI